MSTRSRRQYRRQMRTGGTRMSSVSHHSGMREDASRAVAWIQVSEGAPSSAGISWNSSKSHCVRSCCTRRSPKRCAHAWVCVRSGRAKKVQRVAGAAVASNEQRRTGRDRERAKAAPTDYKRRPAGVRASTCSSVLAPSHFV